MAINQSPGTSICSYHFFINQTTLPLTAAYAAEATKFMDVTSTTINFVSKGVIIANDSGSTIQFSLDGINDHGIILAGEILTFDWYHRRNIFLKGAAGGEAYRFWAW